MKVVGLTGGIGSGKSVVAKVFRSLSVPVFDSDLAGRRVLDDDPEVRREVTQLFGPDVYDAGRADRRKIAAVVFEDNKALEALNAIVHPAVGRATDRWLEKLSDENVPYAIKEAAILFETGIYKSCDAMITVMADETIRTERVMKRDGVSSEEVQQRMLNQWTDEQKKALSDHIIKNEGNSSVIAQVCSVHKALIDSLQ